MDGSRWEERGGRGELEKRELTEGRREKKDGRELGEDEKRGGKEMREGDEGREEQGRRGERYD